MENLSREELLLVKEKFPDTLISKFFDEYFPNDNADSISSTKSSPNDESASDSGLRQKFNNLRENSSYIKNPHEFINTSNKQNHPNSPVSSSRSRISMEILNKDEISASEIYISKYYDEYFQNPALSPISSNHEESNFALRFRIRESVNNMKASAPFNSINKQNFQDCQINTFNAKTRIVSARKSIKMTVPSNKRQVLEEEFRKEKYPSNEKLQKMSIKLSMRYDEVQNYFKKRRREEKETNHKFSNLVKLLDNYLEQED